MSILQCHLKGIGIALSSKTITNACMFHDILRHIMDFLRLGSFFLQIDGWSGNKHWREKGAG